MNKMFNAMVLSTLLCVPVLANDTDNNIKKLLKDRTNLDFQVISNDSKFLHGASFVIVQSPSGERLSLLASKDGKYIVPLSDGIADNNEVNNPLKTALNNVNQYNKDMKDSNVLSIFKKNKDSILKIPAINKTDHTVYMVLDTTCPYCLREVAHIEDYLKEANLEILIVGILGQRSQDRAAGYYAELPNAKNKESKIALLKKVFDVDYQPTNSNKKLSNEMTSLAIGAGIQGVPYVIGK